MTWLSLCLQQQEAQWSGVERLWASSHPGGASIQLSCPHLEDIGQRAEYLPISCDARCGPDSPHHVGLWRGLMGVGGRKHLVQNKQPPHHGSVSALQLLL